MRKFFLMQPRQSGKTTKALYEYSKEPNNTLYVTHNNNSCEYIKSIIGKDCNVTSCKTIPKSTRGRMQYRNIILDEYLFYDNKDVVYNEIYLLNPENIYIYSTPNKIYNKYIFDIIKNNKSQKYFNEILKDFKISNEIDEAYELYYNFLTDNDTILIETNFNMKYYKENSRIYLDEEKYNREYKNIYLK